MTREEKAYKLGQEYFPDESNFWARPNFEAQWVSDACMKMAEWERQRFVDMACKWLKENLHRYVSRDNPDDFPYGFPTRDFRLDLNFERDFRKTMEE